jgi:hypothetical protein
MKNIVTMRAPRAALMATAMAAALYPACGFAGSSNYVFKVVGHPTDTTVAVEIVNTTTGQPVAGAKLYSVRWTFTGIKNMPQRQIQTALTPTGDGAFIAETGDSDRLQLTATIPGENELVHGSVDASR